MGCLVIAPAQFDYLPGHLLLLQNKKYQGVQILRENMPPLTIIRRRHHLLVEFFFSRLVVVVWMVAEVGRRYKQNDLDPVCSLRGLPKQVVESLVAMLSRLHILLLIYQSTGLRKNALHFSGMVILWH